MKSRLLIALIGLSLLGILGCKNVYPDVSTEPLGPGGTSNLYMLVGAGFASTGSSSDTPYYLPVQAQVHADLQMGTATQRINYGFLGIGADTQIYIPVTNTSLTTTYCGIQLNGVKLIDNIFGQEGTTLNLSLMGETGQIPGQKLTNNCLKPGQTGVAGGVWNWWVNQSNYVIVEGIQADSGQHWASPTQMTGQSYTIPYAERLEVIVSYDGGDMYSQVVGHFAVLDNSNQVIDTGFLELAPGTSLPTIQGGTFKMVGAYKTPHPGTKVLISLLPDQSGEAPPMSKEGGGAILALLLWFLFV